MSRGPKNPQFFRVGVKQRCLMPLFMYRFTFGLLLKEAFIVTVAISASKYIESRVFGSSHDWLYAKKSTKIITNTVLSPVRVAKVQVCSAFKLPRIRQILLLC